VPRLTSRRRGPFRPEAGGALLVHCSHHKAGTVWFRRVLWRLATACELRFQSCRGEPVAAATDIAFFRSSRLFEAQDLSGRTFRGSHLIRDPRDVVVSGYFYHLWTAERWAQEPDGHSFGGLSYQQYLNSVDRRQGLLAEIEHCAATTLADMAAWDYGRPQFLELRYEEVMADERAVFTRLFGFYGLDAEAVEAGLRAVARVSIRPAATADVEKPRRAATADVEKPRRHVRSGQAGQWRRYFDDEHVERFKELTGDLVVRLGYESAPDWVR